MRDCSGSLDPYETLNLVLNSTHWHRARAQKWAQWTASRA